MQTTSTNVVGTDAVAVRIVKRVGTSRTVILTVAAWAAIGATPVIALAQGAERSAIASSDVLSQISMFSYRDGRKSDLFLRGTPIAANAQSSARVEYENGNAQISAKVKDLPKPATLGPYTTYVLWAVTPDGRAANQGVFAGAEGGKGKLDTQYGASQFALIVTAEPHFAVTAPSTMIALYNVADDVEGAAESKVTTLTERADYSNLTRIAIDKTTPVEIMQGRYAVAIAKSAGADRFATNSYETAMQKLAAAETALNGKNSSQRKTAPGLAREAVTAGEDARRAGMLAATEAQGQAAADEASRVAAQAATEAERQKSATEAAVTARRDLLGRLNAALPTRESDRGLISEIGGVQFATGTADINASARENLAKFSGIVASYPGLRFNVEGHTG